VRSDYGISIAVDGIGNVYVTGGFEGTATFGETSLTSALSDIFVAKYNSSGTLQWVQQAGGRGADYGKYISVDGSGNVYVTGVFMETATFGAVSLTSVRYDDIFVAKYNNSGTIQWAQSAGGMSDDEGNGIAVDGSGNAYVTGYFNGTATFGATSLTSAGSSDIFVAKYNSSGTLQWVRQGGGASSDGGKGITADGSGNVYVTGYFNGTSTFGTTSLTSAGSSDIFVAKYNSSGTILWAQKAGGSNYDEGNGIAVDGGGSVYVTGHLEDTAIFGLTSLTSAGGRDMFVVRVQE
jgi:hypothetical protein